MDAPAQQEFCKPVTWLGSWSDSRLEYAEKCAGRHLKTTAARFKKLSDSAVFFEGRDGVAFVGIDFEDFLQVHQSEDGHHVFVDVAQTKLELLFFTACRKVDQFPDHRRRHEAYVFEVHDDILVFGFDQFQQLFAQPGDAGFVDDTDVLKVDHQNVAVFTS